MTNTTLLSSKKQQQYITDKEAQQLAKEHGREMTLSQIHKWIKESSRNGYRAARGYRVNREWFLVELGCSKPRQEVDVVVLVQSPAAVHSTNAEVTAPQPWYCDSFQFLTLAEALRFAEFKFEQAHRAERRRAILENRKSCVKVSLRRSQAMRWIRADNGRHIWAAKMGPQYLVNKALFIEYFKIPMAIIEMKNVDFWEADYVEKEWQALCWCEDFTAEEWRAHWPNWTEKRESELTGEEIALFQAQIAKWELEAIMAEIEDTLPEPEFDDEKEPLEDWSIEDKLSKPWDYIHEERQVAELRDVRLFVGIHDMSVEKITS